MWDYNHDGVIDYQDEADYWDDIYYEEHRNDYSGGLFNNGSYMPSSKGKKSTTDDIGVFGTILAILGYCVAIVVCVFIAFAGLGICFVCPPLGIIMLIPLYKILGGR